MLDESLLTSQWLHRLATGEPEVLAELFAHYQPRLRRMVQLRLNARLAARVDPSDVLQDVYVDVARQLPDYLRQPRVAFYIWLRGLTWERMLKIHRRHLGTKARDAQRELVLPLESSAQLAAQFFAPGPSPSQALLKEELRQRVQAALAQLAPDDREIILMRDFEGLSNGEAAQALGLRDSGATMRYGRALVRLKDVLTAAGCPGAAP
jgi:RNA polymerase sigma-70 factor, ECF subfamily